MQTRPQSLPSIVLVSSLGFGLCTTACMELELDDQLRSHEHAEVLEPAPDPDPDPEPEPEPDPEPVKAEALVGLHLEELAQLSPFTATYQMSPYPSATHPFTAPEIGDVITGWPVHALQWKDYASAGAFGFDIAAAATDVAAIPGLGDTVDPGDSASLDTLEANGVIFTSDPNGTWMEANFTDPAVGLAYAALVMHFWGSPVYFGGRHHYPPHGTTVSHAIALQRLTFTIPSAPDLLAACGLPANASAATALSTIPNCNHGAVLTADEVSLWNYLILSVPSNPTHADYDDDVNLAVNDLINAYQWGWGVQGQLVFDPPAAATGEDLAGIAVLAEALRDQLLVADADGYLTLIDDYVAELEPPPPIKG